MMEDAIVALEAEYDRRPKHMRGHDDAVIRTLLTEIRRLNTTTLASAVNGVVLLKSEWKLVVDTLQAKAHRDFKESGHYEMAERRLSEEIARQAGVTVDKPGS